ncbi:unnamed protein product [Coffea canephora]|uniref:3'-5' exonuclease domain-containing protein n=1 Tax=Coffea canephora TaxID=49390 RepID=A0A068UBL0_COFCA|nr:unnamed protein product [Coffea canephora]
MESTGEKPKLTSSSIYWVSCTDSPEFAHLSWCLTHSTVVGIDAEWKPHRSRQSTFPTVSLLQIACRLFPDSNESPVFLLDLSGCDPGFDRVEPFLDITSVYSHLQHKQSSGRKVPKQSKSLATICQEVLGVSLSKELQCSDWSHRPLSEEQKAYAAADAQCLLDIFNVFQAKVEKEVAGNSFHRSSNFNLGLKQILEISNCCQTVLRKNVSEASNVIRATMPEFPGRIPAIEAKASEKSSGFTKEMDVILLRIARKYGDKILLKDSDRKPKMSKKGKRSSAGMTYKERLVQSVDDWQGAPPWDLSVGGDGCPKFLCDVMVEGLAKHLRCVGIDAAIPHSKNPGTRDLIDQANKEKRVLLTRDAKLLTHNYLIKHQIYMVKSLLKNQQLLEVIETFQLKICEDQLMSRCTKCNGKFIQKPLTTEEAVEAAKGFQVIPNCLFNKNLEFWQCMDCNQLYWEGTQYHNAVQKFINVCNLNE